MIAQKREKVGSKTLTIRNRSADAIELDAGETQAVNVHAVVRLILRLAVLERKHVVNNHLRSFVAQCIRKRVIGMPYQLLRSAAHVGRQTGFFPKHRRHKGFICLTVPQKEYVMSACVSVILCGKRAFFFFIAHVFRQKQCLRKGKQNAQQKKRTKNRDQSFYLYVHLNFAPP
ncbi:unknown [Clostridium sp. CAG:448]|nr:unknown [Clostridium sp. CAG:448]